MATKNLTKTSGKIFALAFALSIVPLVLFSPAIADSQTYAPPVVTAVTGPISLAVGEVGTWEIRARGEENERLTYSVQWGDEGQYSTLQKREALLQNQIASFTHSYAQTGNYNVVFTVTNEDGQTARATVSVRVGSGTTPSPSNNERQITIRVLNDDARCIQAPCEIPVPSAQITVYGMSARVVETKRTDNQGYATFNLPTRGTYWAVISAGNFITRAVTFNIPYAGQVFDVRLSARGGTPTPPQPSPNIEVSVRTDRQTYDEDDMVTIYVTASNETNVSQTLNFNTGCQASYRLGSFNLDAVRSCIQSLTSVTIPAGDEKTWTFTHDLEDRPVGTGQQTVIGRVEGYGQDSTSIRIEEDNNDDEGVIGAIQVTRPNGGEVFRIGTRERLSWRILTDPVALPIPNTIDTVDLILRPFYPPCTGNICPQYLEQEPFVLARDFPATSSGLWRVGGSLDYNRPMLPGQYKLQVCFSDTNYCDESDGAFRLEYGM